MENELERKRMELQSYTIALRSESLWKKEVNRPESEGLLYAVLCKERFHELERSIRFATKWKGLENKLILDAMCGGGMYSQWFAEIGCRVVGVDLSMDFCLVAKERKIQRGFEADFIRADINLSPFKDNNYFDLVFISAALHHLLDVRNALKELCKVGETIIIINEPLVVPMIERLGLTRKEPLAKNLKPRRFKIGEIDNWLQDNGYSIIWKRREQFLVPMFIRRVRNKLLIRIASLTYDVFNKMFWTKVGTTVSLIAVRKNGEARVLLTTKQKN